MTKTDPPIVEDNGLILKPTASRESTSKSNLEDDVKLGEEARGDSLESGQLEGDETYYKDGVGKPLPEDRPEDVPFWLWRSIERRPLTEEIPSKGGQFCYYVKHIFKGMILQGCTLEALSQLTGSHVNTFRKLRDSLKGQAPRESWVHRDLRCRRGRKELATLEWRMRGLKVIDDLVTVCKAIRCEDLILCFDIAYKFEPAIPIEFVKAPFMDIRDQTAGSASVGEKCPKGSGNIDFPRSKGNHERNRIESLDVYLKDSV